jgi:hypothetical protein
MKPRQQPAAVTTDRLARVIVCQIKDQVGTPGRPIFRRDRAGRRTQRLQTSKACASSIAHVSHCFRLYDLPPVGLSNG